MDVATHPAPEVAARLAHELEIPRNAARLAALAIEHGWTVRITYARGTWPSRAGKVVDSIALRCRRDRGRAVGIWLDGAFHSAHYWAGGSAAAVVGRVNAGELRERLSAEAS